MRNDFFGFSWGFCPNSPFLTGIFVGRLDRLLFRHDSSDFIENDVDQCDDTRAACTIRKMSVDGNTNESEEASLVGCRCQRNNGNSAANKVVV